jgi:hypothetical protein
MAPVYVEVKPCVESERTRRFHLGDVDAGGFTPGSVVAREDLGASCREAKGASSHQLA